jgi:hypothetical protein
VANAASARLVGRPALLRRRRPDGDQLTQTAIDTAFDEVLTTGTSEAAN